MIIYSVVTPYSIGSGNKTTIGTIIRVSFVHGALVMDSLDGSVARDTPSELSFSPLVVSVYFVWGFIFLLIVLLLCVIGLMPVASQQR